MTETVKVWVVDNAHCGDCGRVLAVFSTEAAARVYATMGHSPEWRVEEYEMNTLNEFAQSAVCNG